MTTDRPYARAPISEAIIDLRVEPVEGLLLAQLASCHDGESVTYPTKAILNRAIGQFSLAEPSESIVHSATAEQIGFSFKSVDEKQIFQARREGFTVNRLAPYPGWETFRNEARRLWTIYRERTKPRRVARIALRYINRFDFPSTGIALKDYLRTSPEVSPQLPQLLAGFLMQLAIAQPEIEAMLLLSETTVSPPTPNISSIALDIDLFRTDDLPADEAKLWELFEVLRRRAHEIFESCITDKAREFIV